MGRQAIRSTVHSMDTFEICGIPGDLPAAYSMLSASAAKTESPCLVIIFVYNIFSKAGYFSGARVFDPQEVSMGSRKRIVIFGGGSGLSQLLKGISQFPWDVTAVVSVSDNGKSTGALRKEFDIPAVGDITKVMMAMSEKPDAVKDLFMYRFSKGSGLEGHSIKNLIMTALLEMNGDFAHSIPILCDLLDVKGHLYPVTEDNVDLIGITRRGRRIVGEEQITKDRSSVKELIYDKPVHVSPQVLSALKKANLIVFSSGSLVTSILPHIIIPEIQDAVRSAKAKKIYVCNMITQPGETDGFSVSDHIRVMERYLGESTFDAVIANDGRLPGDIATMARSEGKDPVSVDLERLKEMGIDLIEEHLAVIEDGYLRHNSLKTAYLMFSYLMDSSR